jgi:teichuronic acid biosynthesis glycosyltransferase TuaC
MRILTFTSLFPDSTRPTFCIFVYQRMAHVARRSGNRVTVVAPVPWAPRWAPGGKARGFRAIPREEDFGGLRVYHPRYFFVPKLGRYIHAFLMFLGSYRLARRLAAQGVDCIDSHFVYPDGMCAVLLGKALCVPVVVSARGTDINLYPRMPVVGSMLRWTLRRARGLVGVCQALSDEMIRLGAPASQVATIGNGVDSQRFQPLDRNAARAMLGIPADAKVVVSVGGLSTHKGHHLTIAAVAELRRRGLPVKLYIAGEGPAREGLQRQIADLRLADHVRLLGTVPNEELHRWYSAADVSCLASSREGWANVLLESMACGTPVVASRIWGTPEVVVSDRLGLLVDVNAEAIASGLESALSRLWDRAAISAHARTQSWESVAQKVEEWLARCSQTNTASRAESAGVPK